MLSLRGATRAQANTPQAIHDATLSLCEAMDEANDGVIGTGCVAMWLTATPDLNAAFPAEAVRRASIAPLAGLLCAQEIPVEGAMSSVIRILALVWADEDAGEAHDVYLAGTSSLLEKADA
jgi:chorismate mutase